MQIKGQMFSNRGDIYMCVCMCVCVCVYIYIYMHTYVKVDEVIVTRTLHCWHFILKILKEGVRVYVCVCLCVWHIWQFAAQKLVTCLYFLY